MHIEVECSKCLVAKTCPSRGSSPVEIDGRRYLCRIVGGYGRRPVDKSIMSKETLAISKRDGDCLTISEVPYVEESGTVVYKVVKIFSPAVLADREKCPAITSSDVMLKSCK